MYNGTSSIESMRIPLSRFHYSNFRLIKSTLKHIKRLCDCHYNISMGCSFDRIQKYIVSMGLGLQQIHIQNKKKINKFK